MKILITGGTGLVGKQLQKDLLEKGHHVIVLTRSKKKSDHNNLHYSVWDYTKEVIDINTVCSVDHIIHLAGTNVAGGKWTESQKKSILESRTLTANLIFKTLKNNPHQVKSFISASGSNAYGVQTTKNIYKETDPFGNDFLANVCEQWENATSQFKLLNIKTVSLRTGVVFAKENSALQKMLPPIKMGIGSALGSGQQIMPIIHVKDLSSMYIHAIENNLNGAYNAIAENLSNQNLSLQIAKQLNKPFFFPKVPAFVLNLLFGEMADILLKGSALNNTKIKETNFVFKYPNLKSILENVL